MWIREVILSSVHRYIEIEFGFIDKNRRIEVGTESVAFYHTN